MRKPIDCFSQQGGQIDWRSKTSGPTRLGGMTANISYKLMKYLRTPEKYELQSSKKVPMFAEESNNYPTLIMQWTENKNSTCALFKLELPYASVEPTLSVISSHHPVRKKGQTREKISSIPYPEYVAGTVSPCTCSAITQTNRKHRFVVESLFSKTKLEMQ